MKHRQYNATPRTRQDGDLELIEEIDENGNALVSFNQKLLLTPNRAALASTKDTTISSATSITLNDATTMIEVQAVNQGVFLKYGAGVTTSDNGWDEHIMADTVRHFIIPSGVTVISVIEDAASATVYIIEK